MNSPRRLNEKEPKHKERENCERHGEHQKSPGPKRYNIVLTKIKALKVLVLGTGAQKNLSFIESHTTWIHFNVTSRTNATLIKTLISSSYV